MSQNIGQNHYVRIGLTLMLIYKYGMCQSIIHFMDEPLKVFEGDCRHNNISLPCGTTDDLAANQKVIWEKFVPSEGRFLVIFSNTDQGVLGKAEPRYSVTNGTIDNEFTLSVKDINCSDAGEYRCSIAPSRPAESKITRVYVGKCSVENIKFERNTLGVSCSAKNTKPQSLLKLSHCGAETILKESVLTHGSLTDVNCTTNSHDAELVYSNPQQPNNYQLQVLLDNVTVYDECKELTVESTTTAESTTSGPVPSSTTVYVPPPPLPHPCSPICIVIIVAVVVGVIVIIILACCLWKKKKCPCQQSSGNVPYEFEIDGVKEDKTIEISPGMLIRLAATCYGAKPPASIQWCISYNGKDPVDMTEKDYGNSDALNTSVTTNKRDPKTSDTHSKLEMVPNEDHDGAVIHCVAITKISADEEKWDLKTSPKITLKLKKGQVGDYPGQGGYYQGQGGDHRHQGGDYRGQDGYHQGQGGDNHGQGGNYHRYVGQAGQEYQPHGNTRVMYDNASNVTKIPIGNYPY